MLADQRLGRAPEHRDDPLGLERLLEQRVEVLLGAIPRSQRTGPAKRGAHLRAVDLDDRCRNIIKLFKDGERRP